MRILKSPGDFGKLSNCGSFIWWIIEEVLMVFKVVWLKLWQQNRVSKSGQLVWLLFNCFKQINLIINSTSGFESCWYIKLLSFELTQNDLILHMPKSCYFLLDELSSSHFQSSLFLTIFHGLQYKLVFHRHWK